MSESSIKRGVKYVTINYKAKAFLNIIINEWFTKNHWKGEGTILNKSLQIHWS